jgi:ribosomal protein S11
MGFRGSKKNTPYAAQMAEDCSKVLLKLTEKKVYVKGPGNGRESAIRSLHNMVELKLQRLSMLPNASQWMSSSKET